MPLLIFPNVNRMSDFVLSYEVYGVEVNSRELSLSGKLSDELVSIAVTQYHAYQKPFYNFPNSDQSSHFYEHES